MTRSDKALAAIARWLTPHLGTAVTNFDPRKDSDGRAAEVGAYIAETRYFNLAEADIIAAAKATERRDVLAFLRAEIKTYRIAEREHSTAQQWDAAARVGLQASAFTTILAYLERGDHEGAAER
jgi:hypothetical protein